MIIVNFKAYDNAVGTQAVRLAKICQQVSLRSKIPVAVAVQPTDVYAVRSAVKIPVYSQHVDAVGAGAHTGWLLPESLAAVKGYGSLVNHSEHKVPFSWIKQNVKRLRELRLRSVVCAPGPTLVKKIRSLKPDHIAYEPPSLIGGKVSVSSAKPSVIKTCVNAAGKVPLLVGAGVHTAEDVRVALELGAVGVLVASGVVKARNPKTELQKLCQGFH